MIIINMIIALFWFTACAFGKLESEELAQKESIQFHFDSIPTQDKRFCLLV